MNVRRRDETAIRLEKTLHFKASKIVGWFRVEGRLLCSGRRSSRVASSARRLVR